MKWTGLNELREKYLSFFESKGHLRMPSFPLIPQNDNSLLLINSGMAPMKKYFTGEIIPPRNRVTTCQKCIRTPDIERVGKTARHGTYFEMLGNFSFGDYFKHEATAWAWEFCTKVLELPEDKLWVTIYQDDDQAYDIWAKEIGVAPERIVRLGKEDNFWEHGSGPCGPCSEIHFDRGEQYGCGSPDCAPGCDCDRYTEFWNLVFTQFNSDGKGNYSDLEHPNIDTGMGLERLACIIQEVDNLFEVDTVQKIMQHVMRIAHVNYHENEKKDVSLRVITDHIRSTTFMIGDGVMPSNEGRGYVLRRLLRRAARHGRLLGIEQTFLSGVSRTVIEENENAYPNLKEKQDLIQKIIQKEEESFGRTIDTGLQLLENLIAGLSGDTLSGDEAFKLYDTYGFPIDLTKEILEEKGLRVDEKTFDERMLEQRKRARNARKDAGADAWSGSAKLTAALSATQFVGYTQLACPAGIIAILNNGELVDALGGDEEGVLILDQTPFYGEGGGQVGDIGTITFPNCVFDVTDTTKTHDGIFLHHGKARQGACCVGDTGTAEVSEQTRRAIMRNHTAAHLLQSALRRVLGAHVEQAGQLVSAKEMRFDFTHFSALTKEELHQVENLVNGFILKAQPVTMTEMPMDEAKKLGAMALFGEKYGDVVRVVQAGEFSAELCGGTHVANSGELGLFKIVSESSVAAGVRRITAVTGEGSLRYVEQKEDALAQVAQLVKAGNSKELVEKLQQFLQDMKQIEKEAEKLRSQIAAVKAESLLNNPKPVGGVQLITAQLDQIDADALRSLGDQAKAFAPNVVAVLAGTQPEKGTANFIAVCGKDAVKLGVHAGNLVREVAKLAGGSGGGRPDSAMAGARGFSEVPAALEAVEDILLKLLKQ